MEKPHPYVSAALLCEKILQEKDESISLVRIADRIQYRTEGVPPGVKPLIALQAFVSLKSGPVTGEHTLTITLENPKGVRKEAVRFPLNFLGKDHGQNLIVNLSIGVEHDGIYWFDVAFDGNLLSRIPVAITASPEPTTAEEKG